MPPVLGERAEAVSGDLATTDLPFCVANAHTEQRDIPDISLNIEKGRRTMIKALWNDEAGVILSAEIVLIGTILVIGMVVGLVELQCSVVDELNDLGEAIGSMNQSFMTSSVGSIMRSTGTYKAITYGSSFTDRIDSCDSNECAVVCIVTPLPEARK